MADYLYNTIHIYDNGGSFNRVAQDDDTGTASDGESDSSFNPGDTFTATFEDITTSPETPFQVTITYEGFVTLDGERLPVGSVDAGQFPPDLIAAAGVQGDGVFVILDHRDVSDVDAPATFDVASALTAQSCSVCFAAGTGIATPGGDVAIERLAIGDEVLTANGRAVPVKWIGRQTVQKRFTPADRFAPVRVSAGALGGGLPRADLVLTTDHALVLEGLAINAGALVNGTTIARVAHDELPERVTYYHVETEEHEVILAHGAPAETYLDYVQRRAFDNHADYVALYGEERTIREMNLPRISSARLVPPAIRARLDGAAVA